MPDRPRRVLRVLGPVVGLALLVLAVLSAARHLAGVDRADLAAALAAVPPERWAVAALLTAASYAVLAGYEALAVRAVGVHVAPRRALLAGVLGWAVSNGVGPAWLSGGAVRLRLYRGWDVPAADVAKIVAFGLLTFWLGFAATSGAALALDPPASMEGWGRPVGLAVLGLVAALGVAGGRRAREVRLLGRAVRWPGAPTVGAQVALGVADHLAAIGALYVLLPPGAELSFVELVALFALSNLAGIVSGLPGGAGTFDGALVALAAAEAEPAAVLGAVVGWRLLYTVLPLLLAATTLAAREVPLRRMTRVGRPALATFAFAAGLALVTSALTPADPSRLRWLADVDWIVLLETSHAASAAIGVGLLFVARGLWLGLREAWTALVLLLALGVVASLTRGLDWESAVALGIVLGLAIPMRGRFPRRAALTDEVLPARRAAAVAVSVAVLALLAFSVAEPSAAPVPDVLRSLTVGLAVVPTAMLGSLLRPARIDPPGPSEEDVRDALRIASEAGVSEGRLAALGDKALLFDADRTTFLMYGAARGTWVAFAGPMGPARIELLWTFRELAHAAGARIALYEIPADLVPACVDLGLQAYKFGEEAVVDLATFTLEGRDNKGRRNTLNRLEREGCRFEVLAPDDRLLEELRGVSDAWLADKGASEKRFSLGWFDPAWLRRGPVAVVRRDGAIVAFANLLEAGPELSVDLMRYVPDAPGGTMDFLFLSLLAWGRAQGFARFSAGMAPLAGLPDNALAPLWAKVGAFVFRHGESFYNFQGLRAFKEKLRPRWEPRYLAVQGPVGLPTALRALTDLVHEDPVRRPGRRLPRSS